MNNTQLLNRTQAFSPNRRLTRTEQLWLLGFLIAALAAIICTRVAQADSSLEAPVADWSAQTGR